MRLVNLSSTNEMWFYCWIYAEKSREGHNETVGNSDSKINKGLLYK